MGRWRIGVDIGGTFTDVAVVDEDRGAIGIAKTPTTPRDFADGVLTGLREALAANGVVAEEVGLLSHATTIVTNALLEQQGCRAAIVTTRGFRDVLELRRSARAELYNLFQDPPSVLIPRHLRLEIEERVSAEGDVVIPLQESHIDRLIDALKALEVEAVAVSLLFSFLNDVHERRLGERLRAALPGVPVFLSCEVLPEVQEFERSSTTAVCAYVGPLLESYLSRVEAATAGLGLPRLHIMTSAGGVVEVDEALRMPASIVESGPAAGVIGARLVGEQIGEPTLLSFDMGGTTAKACLINNGEVETTTEYEVGGAGSQNRWVHGTGHPIRVPVIDLAEVSAGGGSIVWIDPAGSLQVGPRSAGAEPGPVCYGRGGDAPTVTDANLVLGYLDATSLLGGRMAIDYAAAQAALEARIARPLGITAEEAAAAIVRIVNNAMAEALRIVSIERGHDPRELNMVAFGGAGGLHAAALAEELGIPGLIIPPIPGGFSALGLIGTDIRRDYARTLYAPLDGLSPERLAAVWQDMEDQGRAMLAVTGVAESAWEFRRSAGLRYARQAYDLTVAAPAGEVTTATLAEMAEAFHQVHHDTYGHRNPGEPVTFVTARLTAVGRLPRFELAQRVTASGDSLKGKRRAIFPLVGALACEVHDRERMAPGAELSGPAIIEAFDSTVVVPPDWLARVDRQGFLRLTRSK